jgi:hypothetical protein
MKLDLTLQEWSEELEDAFAIGPGAWALGNDDRSHVPRRVCRS